VIVGDTVGTFSLNSLDFDSNEAEYGKDVFISASSLKSFVTPERFSFYLNITNKEEEFMGTQNSLFSDPISLFFFVDG
jgi:hypothetical protein